MSLETSFPSPLHRKRDAAPHLSREEYQKSAIEDLEDQIASIENAVESGASGRSAHKYLLSVAYAQLLKLKDKGLLTKDQAASFQQRAKALDAQLYEEAA